MTNSEYSVEELITNDFFLAYVFNTDELAINYWQDWIKQHPEQLSLVQEATFMAQSLALQPTLVSEETIETELQRLENSLTESKIIPFKPAREKKNLAWWRKWQAVAAAILLLLISTLAIRYYAEPSNAMLVVTTKSGSPAMLLLPDSSLVFLSGNSTIRYNKIWPQQAAREVWLEGEAFFHVKPRPIAGGVKFQVYAGQAIVEVVGTRFNVLNRNNQTNVVLTSGKVNFKVKEGAPENQITLVPGEMVSLKRDSLRPKKNKIDVLHYPVLKEEKIVFEDTSVRKIILLLKEHYGLKVNLQDSAIADLTVSGSFPLNNEASFLKTLAVVLNLDIKRKTNQEVYFQYK